MKSLLIATLSFTSAWAFAQPLPLKKEVKFTRACEPGELFLLAGVGDVLLHGPLQQKAAARQSFETLWDEVTPYIQGADIAYANLEGPTAKGVNIYGKPVKDPGFKFDNVVYTSYPQFNYHPSLIPSLMNSGFDILSSANNHSLDRRTLGADRTVEALDEEEMPFTGTRKSTETEKTRSWVRVVAKGNLKTAWIACTFATNGLPDKANQVFKCLEQKTRLIELVKEYAKKVDAVIVTPHWGDEYVTQPNPAQVKLGRELILAGAMAVLGSHPHVLEPMEKVIAENGREGFIIYSLGNFVSYQDTMQKRTSGILYLGITKNARGTFLNGAKLLPAYMENRSGNDLIRLTVMPKPKQTVTAQAAHVRSIFAESNLVWKGEEIVPNGHCRM